MNISDLITKKGWSDLCDWRAARIADEIDASFNINPTGFPGRFRLELSTTDNDASLVSFSTVGCVSEFDEMAVKAIAGVNAKLEAPTDEDIESMVMRGIAAFVEDQEEELNVSVRSFDEAGVMSNRAGVVIKVRQAEYQLTIVRSK